METGYAATEILFDGGGGQSMAATREVVSPYIKGSICCAIVRSSKEGGGTTEDVLSGVCFS